MDYGEVGGATGVDGWCRWCWGWLARDVRKGSLRKAAGEVAVDVGVFRSSSAGAEALWTKSQGRNREVAPYSTVLSPSSSLRRWTQELDGRRWRWKVRCRKCWRLEVGVFRWWTLEVEVGCLRLEVGLLSWWTLDVDRWKWRWKVGC